MVPHHFDGPVGDHFVGPTWRDADFRISFAKNKTHTWAWYTLCLKNIYGTLPLQNKIHEYHYKREIYYPTIDMLVAFPVHFGIVDAFIGADGPFGIFADKDPNPTRTVIAGENIVAVDWVGASKMGLDPMVSRYMQLAVQVFGRPKIDLVGDGSVLPKLAQRHPPAGRVLGQRRGVLRLHQHGVLAAQPRVREPGVSAASGLALLPTGRTPGRAAGERGLPGTAAAAAALAPTCARRSRRGAQGPRSAAAAATAGSPSAAAGRQRGLKPSSSCTTYTPWLLEILSHAALHAPLVSHRGHSGSLHRRGRRFRIGGGIAASRLARAGQKVCLLERGKERQPGEYPDTEIEAVEEMQADTPEGRLNARNGLFDMRFYDDINVLVGCGLGGTSLINANVSLRADPRLFDDARWPTALKADLPTLVEDGYRRAFDMLKPNPVPAAVKLAKLSALEKSGAAIGRAVRAPADQRDVRAPGGQLRGRRAAGLHPVRRLLRGCNVGSKNTVQMTYLADAVQPRRRDLHRVAGPPRLAQRRRTLARALPAVLDARREKFAAAEQSITADVVDLSPPARWAPPRSCCAREPPGLPSSDRLGERFTGNGDVLAFAYNNDDRGSTASASAHRAASQTDASPVGAVHHRPHRPARHPRLEDGMVIEEGSIPGAGRPPPARAAGGRADADRHGHRRGASRQLREKRRQHHELRGRALPRRDGATRRPTSS